MSEPFSGDQYRQLLDTAPDAIVVVDRASRIVLVNRQTETLFGYERAELIGEQLELLVPVRLRGGHASHVERYFQAPTVRSMGSGLELFGVRRDGVELAIEVSLSPLQTEKGWFVSAAIRDIGERKRMLVAYQQSAERLISAVESIDEAFALFDAQGSLCLYNNVYGALMAQVQSGDLLGSSYAAVIELEMELLSFATSADRDAFRQMRREERALRNTTYEMTTTSRRHYRVTSQRTPEGGLVRLLADVSEDAARTEELRRARRDAEAGSAAKSEFLASMSHELRTPLNAILGFAQLARRDKKEPLPPRHAARIDQILKGGEHLLRLIDDILDLARIEAGGVSISNERIDLLEVLEEVIGTLEQAALRANVELEMDPTEPVVPAVLADRTRVAQILMNLGSNAIKYNRAGGHVTWMVSQARGRVRVVVRDDGIGIPEAKRHTLFQPFQRAGQETGAIEGTGIGLVISRRLAELMDGAVGYRPRVPVGSEFWVELPVDEREPQTLDPALRSSGTSLQGSMGCVLYVEDNPANVVFMQDVLSTFEGTEVIVAGDAEQGIELARARRPKVILMDINLPGMDGFEALTELRRDTATAEIPVIALTAAASERDRRRGEHAGFYRYLTKPVRIDELEEALRSLL